jgi:prefoldin subunit 5
MGPVYGAPKDEAQALKEEAAYLQGQLEDIQRRLAELENA